MKRCKSSYPTFTTLTAALLIISLLQPLVLWAENTPISYVDDEIQTAQTESTISYVSDEEPSVEQLSLNDGQTIVEEDISLRKEMKSISV